MTATFSNHDIQGCVFIGFYSPVLSFDMAYDVLRNKSFDIQHYCWIFFILWWSLRCFSIALLFHSLTLPRFVILSPKTRNSRASFQSSPFSSLFLSCYFHSLVSPFPSPARISTLGCGCWFMVRALVLYVQCISESRWVQSPQSSIRVNLSVRLLREFFLDRLPILHLDIDLRISVFFYSWGGKDRFSGFIGSWCLGEWVVDS